MEARGQLGDEPSGLARLGWPTRLIWLPLTLLLGRFGFERLDLGAPEPDFGALGTAHHALAGSIWLLCAHWLRRFGCRRLPQRRD